MRHAGPVALDALESVLRALPRPRPLTLAAVRRLVPPRPAVSHKGDYGHVLVVAGSRGMAGAAGLSGLGALRSGAGLVTLAVPRSIQSTVAAVAPEALTAALPGSAGRLDARAALAVKRLVARGRFTAFAVGPGLSTAPSVRRALPRVLGAAARLPLVIDADALNCLALLGRARAARLLKTRVRPVVITPHPGELARLLGVTRAKVQADRVGHAMKAARMFGAVCLLKGHRTVISDGRAVFVNPTGNPGMAKGGMGDVLTGLIGGLLAQGMGESDAACLGAYLHGLAGNLAARRAGRAALLARDLAAALPLASRRLSR